MKFEYLYDVADDIDAAHREFEGDVSAAQKEIEELDDLIDDRLKELYSIRDVDMHREYVSDLEEFVQRRRRIYNEAMDRRDKLMQELDEVEEKLLKVYTIVEEFDENHPDFPGEDDVDLSYYMSD